MSGVEVLVLIIAVLAILVSLFLLVEGSIEGEISEVIVAIVVFLMGMYGFVLLEEIASEDILYDVKCTRDGEVVYVETTDEIPDDYDSCYYTVHVE